MVETILMLAEQAPKSAILKYYQEHGLGWEDSRGWNVYLGDDQDIEMKLNVYRSILAHLKAQDTPPTVISVEYVHFPYYRLEP